MSTLKVPEIYQDDGALIRIRKLQKPLRLVQLGLWDEDIEALLDKYHQAFEYSLLPISEAEQVKTLEILEAFHPMVWHVVQEINFPGQDPSQGRLGPLDQTTAPGRKAFAQTGVDYKPYLKTTILTLDRERKYIRKTVNDVLGPHWKCKPLPAEYSRYQAFADKQYPNVSRWFLYMMISVVLAPVVLLVLLGFSKLRS